MSEQPAADGAVLYHEARGSGPTVVILQGGAGEAGATEGLVTALAESFRVVTYDRRGIARSPRPDERRVTISDHAADVAGLLEAVSSGPALVYGISIGALIGLHLAVEHPGQVSTVVAHEPPMSTIVRDPERERAMDQVEATFRERGPMPAMRAMAAVIGLDPATMEFEDDARPALPTGDPAASLRTFFTHDVPAVRSSALTVADVATAGVTTIPTGASCPEATGSTGARRRWPRPWGASSPRCPAATTGPSPIPAPRPRRCGRCCRRSTTGNTSRSLVHRVQRSPAKSLRDAGGGETRPDRPVVVRPPV